MLRFKKIAIILLSCFVGVMFVEIIFSIFTNEAHKVYKWDYRYMLIKQLDNGPVFNNKENFFIYQPNKKIESTTFYYVGKKWTKEYDYAFQTNNLGLVQTNPTLPNRDSLLLLGDSFTEGVGAYPWFENFRKNLKTNLQSINGGVLGTGFQSWKFLHDYLVSNNIRVKKIVIIFISEDYVRGTYTFPNEILSCIQTTKFCKGDEVFFGKPPNNELEDFLEKKKNYREHKFMINGKLLKIFIKNHLPAMSTIASFIKSLFPDKKYDLNISKNNKVIQDFVARYGQNILFIHIPQKDEIVSGKINKNGEKAINSIRAANGVIFDGHSKCEFQLADYFVNDGHPNAKGYKKVAECVKTAMRLHWGY